MFVRKELIICGFFIGFSALIVFFVFEPTLVSTTTDLSSFKITLSPYLKPRKILTPDQKVFTQKPLTWVNNVWNFEEFQNIPDTVTAYSDTLKHRILLMGDSEVGGFKFPLSKYCTFNGHKLIGVIEWNSSTVFNFAYSDTVDALITKFKPTYIIVILGLNEVYAKDLNARTQAAYLLKKKFNQIPYAWIGPASWVSDYGISNAFALVAGSDRFFNSAQLQLPRASDQRHPSFKGYEIWMDSVAKWLGQKPVWPLPLKIPAGNFKSTGFITVFLNAAKYRGY